MCSVCQKGMQSTKGQTPRQLNSMPKWDASQNGVNRLCLTFELGFINLYFTAIQLNGLAKGNGEIQIGADLVKCTPYTLSDLSTHTYTSNDNVPMYVCTRYIYLFQ